MQLIIQLKLHFENEIKEHGRYSQNYEKISFPTRRRCVSF
jgi:hypothetical protein